jgi:hypothetical protein
MISLFEDMNRVDLIDSIAHEKAFDACAINFLATAPPFRNTLAVVILAVVILAVVAVCILEWGFDT